MKKINLLLIFLSGFIISAFAQSGIQFEPSWESALAKAAKKQQLVFVDAYATWCGPCKLMDKNVFSQPDVGAFFNENFVNVKVDMEKGIGRNLAREFKIRAYPTLLFVDHLGKVVHQSVGYHYPDQLIELGETAADPNRQYTVMVQKFNNGDRQPKLLKDLSIAASEAMDDNQEAYADAYLATQKDWSSPENMDFLFQMIQSVDSEMYKYLYKNKPDFEERFGITEVAGKMEQIVYNGLYSLGERPKLRDVKKLFEKAYPERTDELLMRYKITHYLKQDKIKKFAKATVKYLDKYPPTDSERWNNYAWDFYELVDKKKYLKKAVEWAKSSIAIEEGYYNTDTLASLYFKLKEKEKAKMAAEKAIGLAEKSGEDPYETKMLLEKINNL